MDLSTVCLNTTKILILSCRFARNVHCSVAKDSVLNSLALGDEMFLMLLLELPTMQHAFVSPVVLQVVKPFTVWRSHAYLKARRNRLHH
jgi:hypothetical protein